MIRRLALGLAAALPAFAGFFMPAAYAATPVAPTYTVPQCLDASAGQDLMVDALSGNDCLLGTTGGPFTLPTSGSGGGFFLLHQGGHILLHQGGALKCHSC